MAFETYVPQRGRASGKNTIRILKSGDLSVSEISVDTPLVLAIHGYGDDNYAMTSGAKRGLGEAYNNAASVIIDLGGDDNYASVEDAIHGFGAGVFGYGYVYDLQGNDSYRAGFIAQGSGIFGTGLLYDAGGDDEYVAVMVSSRW